MDKGLSYPKILTPHEVVKKFADMIENGEPLDKFVRTYSTTLLRILNQRLKPSDNKVVVKKPIQEMTVLEMAIFDRLKLTLTVVVGKETLSDVVDKYRKKLGRPVGEDLAKKLNMVYAIIHELKPKAAERGYAIEAIHGVGYQMFYSDVDPDA